MGRVAGALALAVGFIALFAAIAIGIACAFRFWRVNAFAVFTVLIVTTNWLAVAALTGVAVFAIRVVFTFPWNLRLGWFTLAFLGVAFFVARAVSSADA